MESQEVGQKNSELERERESKPITLQKWLDNEYPTKEDKEKCLQITIGWRDEFKSNLPLTEEQVKKLAGEELDLSEYPNLKKIQIFGNYLKSPLTELELGDKLKLTDLVCSRNRLSSLDLTACPNLKDIQCWESNLVNLKLGELKKLFRLGCSDNNLKELDLTNCWELKEINCKNNRLVNLDLSNCSQLTELWCNKNQLTQLTLPKNATNLQKLVCWNNLLTELDFVSLNPEKITTLGLQSNNFTAQDWDLNLFSNLTQLKKLYLGSYSARNKYDRWVGSLESLKNLTQLEKLYIGNTDIEGNIEYLPKSIKEIYCSNKWRSESKVKTVEEQLNSSSFFNLEGDGCYKSRSDRKESDFDGWYGEKCQALWKSYSFNYQQTKEWKEVLGESFKSEEDWAFCAWLRDEKHLTFQEIKQQGSVLNKLRIEYNKLWVNIHEDFAKNLFLSDKTYRQGWEKEGLTYQDAKEWILAGFKPDNYYWIKEWKDQSFTPEQTKHWLEEAGLELHEASLATYLKENNYTPQQFANKFKNQRNAQQWLDYFYPKEKRNTIKELDISHRNLIGVLDLSDFTNLEGLKISSNQLSDISFLQKLPNPEKLRMLDLSSNSFISDLKPFSRFTNLEELILGKDLVVEMKDDIEKTDKVLAIYQKKSSSLNKFYGSLEPLKELMKLKKLDISDTDIDSGLEYLSDNIEEFVCSASMKEGGGETAAKVKVLSDYFGSGQKETIISQKRLQNWKKHRKNWKKIGFSEQEFKEWIKAGLKINEWDYADYLKKKERNEKKKSYGSSDINRKELRKEYEKHVKKELEKKGSFQLQEEVFEKIKNFNHKNLTSEQKKLIKKLIPNKDLRKKYKEGGLCLECHQPNTWVYKEKSKLVQNPYANKGVWCQPCNKSRLETMALPASNNLQINEFIQKSQREATNLNEVLEWIPYEQFTDIKYLDKGGFGKIYTAEWKNGPIEDWDIKDNLWKRKKNKEVVLKVLNDSRNIDTSFLQEITNHKLCSNEFILPLYGISRTSEGDYVMVMEYMEEGSLRSFLAGKDGSLNFYNKLGERLAKKCIKLCYIIGGIDAIHDQGLVHRDLHPGNILNYNDETCFITDFGLCKPVSETDEKKIYGVLPYVAPEVLRGQRHTQASDIYSLGILASEMLTEKKPYHGHAHNEFLATKICQGLRPDLDSVQAPQFLKDLIKRCWDADPKNRPTAKELKKLIPNSEEEMMKSAKFAKVALQLFQMRKALEKEFEVPSYETHPEAFYGHSRALPTQETAQLCSLLESLRVNFIELDFKSKEETKKFILEKLINSIKSELKSKSKFSETKRKEREEKLEALFKNLPTAPEEFKKSLENIKEGLSERLTDENTRNLYKVKEDYSKSLQFSFLENKVEESQVSVEQISVSWQNIHPNFTEELIQKWQEYGFTAEQCRDWINVGLNIEDYALVAWLKDIKKLVAEQVLNDNSININDLKQEFIQYQQNQIQAQIQQANLPSSNLGGIS